MGHIMQDFLVNLGCHRRRTQPGKFILDEFDTLFYLEFDAEEGDTEESIETVDVIAWAIPDTNDEQIILKSNCNERDVVRLLCGLGLERFSKKTREYIEQWEEE